MSDIKNCNNDLIYYGYKYQFETPMRMVMVAPTGTGKTYRLFKIIEFAREMFDNSKQFETVIYYYNTWSTTFDFYKHMVTEWINEMPTKEKYMEKINKYKDKFGCLIIIDDYMTQMSGDIVDLFTTYSRNNKTSVIVLWQDFFPKSDKNSKVQGICRSIRLNASDIVVFRNVTDKSTFSRFAQQFMPERWRELMYLFNKVTNELYTYLWIDVRQVSDNKFRILSRVCLDEWPMKMYIFDLDENLD